jgi:hypothetical protein
MSDLFDLSVDNFINVQRKTQEDHCSDRNIASHSVFGVQHNE